MKYYKISEESLNKILDYLGKKPYNEVCALIATVFTAQPLEEKVNEEQDSD